MSVVWKTMFLEYFRETNYMAGLAQLSSSIHVHEEYLEFSLNAYNAIDQIEIYLKQLFGSLQTFEADEQFFKNRLNKLIRDLKNNETSEPYERITRMRNHILDGSVSNKQRLELT
jgi:secreted Zn-dependent insulinase-like peptidase